MKDYSDEIRKRFPELDDGTYKLITEFGRYVHANAGWAAARVEYVKREPDRNTAIIHLGADMFLRECYRPEDWQHEIIVADQSGRLKTGNDEKKYVIAGPLCFAGDMIARDIELPAMSPGDYIIIKDSGAYTMSMWSRYNSRQMPKVIGYTENGRDFELIKDRETAEDLVAFWS